MADWTGEEDTVPNRIPAIQHYYGTKYGDSEHTCEGCPEQTISSISSLSATVSDWAGQSVSDWLSSGSQTEVTEMKKPIEFGTGGGDRAMEDGQSSVISSTASRYTRFKKPQVISLPKSSSKASHSTMSQATTTSSHNRYLTGQEEKSPWNTKLMFWEK